MEYYAQKTGLKVSCHHLRHTMATQMLNVDAELVTIQDFLGHSWYHDHTTILPGVQSQGAERLLQSNGGGYAKNGHRIIGP